MKYQGVWAIQNETANAEGRLFHDVEQPFFIVEQPRLTGSLRSYVSGKTYVP